MQNQTDRPGPAQLHNSYPYGAARTRFCPREAALPEAEGSIPAGQHRGCQQDLCNSWKGTHELFHQSSKALQHQVGLHGERGQTSAEACHGLEGLWAHQQQPGLTYSLFLPCTPNNVGTWPGFGPHTPHCTSLTLT